MSSSNQRPELRTGNRLFTNHNTTTMTLSSAQIICCLILLQISKIECDSTNTQQKNQLKPYQLRNQQPCGQNCHRTKEKLFNYNDNLPEDKTDIEPEINDVDLGFDKIVMLEPEALFDSSRVSKSPSLNLVLENQNRGLFRSKRALQPASQHQATSGGASQTSLMDACPSKVELITPYYATNSRGKLRTLVHSELMQQAIQVETCLR